MNTQYSKPKIGSKIAITFAFPSHVLGYEGQMVSTQLTGTVLQETKHTPPNCMCLLVADSDVAIREIPMERVTALAYMDGSQVEREAVKNNIQEWQVDGSRGSVYNVIRNQSRWTCTCPGFQFRKNCRHITELKNA